MTFSTPLFLLLLPVVLGWAAWLWLRDPGSFSPLRHRVALALRLVIMAALILVLAGATWQQPETRQATIFVADLSASVASLGDRETAFIARALAARGPQDVAAVVVVGADALVEQPVAALTAFSGFQSTVDRSATNLEAGLNLAGALFPSGYRKRVVVLTDGRENLGDALAAVRLLRDEGVRVDVVPLSPATGAEAAVTGVDAPSTLRRGARLTLTVTLNSTVAQHATLDVFDDTRLLEQVPVALPVGEKVVTLTLPALGPGFHRLRVLLNPAPGGDTLAENNEGDAVTRVLGAPSVLVAEGLPGEGTVVVRALRAKGMRVQVESAAQVQASTAYLSNFDAVVLVDVPALELDPLLLDPAHSPLSAYVDGGGGLVVIGGPDSYGVGGYTGTALDDLLPVSMKLPQRKDTPSVAVALIIEDLESQTNVDISKAAGEGVIQLLTPEDQVEVNDASGTDSPTNGWAVPLQHVINKAAIKAAIEAMVPVDPLSYTPALTAAFNSLRHANAKIKHIILLGDGDAEDNYYALITRIRKAGITVSTVATGAGGGFPSDYGLMQNIARWGGGRYYPSNNVNDIPTIFLKETKQIARTGIVEERFIPQIVSDSPIIADVPGTPLDGYVATTPKPAGEQVLMHVTKHGLDPILAQWHYGLGRVVAWTSDAQGRWTSALISGAQGNRLWANMVSWVLPPASSPNLSFASSIVGGQAHLTVTTSGLPLDAEVTARVDGPTRATAVTLTPTAPGQYEGDVSATTAGAYLVGVRALVHGRVRATLRTGLVVPYAPEYRVTGLNTHLVTGMAAAGGGALLSRPAASFADNLPSVYAPRPLTVFLLLLALLLLPCDIAARRLLIGPTEVREALAAWMRRRALQPAAAPGTAAAPLTSVRAGRTARRVRAAEQVAAGAQGRVDRPAALAASLSGGHAASASPRPAPGNHPETSGGAPGGQRGQGSLSTDGSPPRPAPATPAAPPPVTEPRVAAPPVAAPPVAESGATATSRLLEAKRRRRGS